MTYRIRWPHRPGARSSTSSPVAAAVWEFAVGPLADNPHRVGKQLREPLEGFWSARRGQHRVIHAIDDDAQVVTIAAVDHGDVYRAPS